jgi:OFA family oxalate/formate antiporter-like MFS transporter
MPMYDQPPRPSTRWIIAVMGTLLQVCLGTVYAWSYFQKPLVEDYHWSNAQVAWGFSLAICCLGIAAAWGGIRLPRYGPRRLAVAGGVLFALGYFAAAGALWCRSLLLLYLGYGVIGGIGLGLGYVTPVATVAKWFPDKKGLITGMVIMGFGFGALLMSKLIAPQLCRLFDGDLRWVFAAQGLAFLVLTVPAALALRDPPPGFVPPGPLANRQGPAAGEANAAARRPLGRTFALLWTVFFCNIIAGVSIISFQSPLFQDLWHRLDARLSKETLAAYGATLIAVSSLFNGFGRILWGGLSDRVGRLRTFSILLGSQIAAFALLVFTTDPWIFGALICYVLLCYGGGFGTMPALVLDTFGSRRMAVAYGCILTAWSTAGIVGPQLLALLKDHYADRASVYAFVLSGVFLAVGLVLTLVIRPERAA